MKYIWNFRPLSNTYFWKGTATIYTLGPISEQIHIFLSLLLHNRISTLKGLCSVVFRQWKPGDHNSIVPRLRAG